MYTADYVSRAKGKKQYAALSDADNFCKSSTTNNKIFNLENFKIDVLQQSQPYAL